MTVSYTFFNAPIAGDEQYDVHSAWYADIAAPGNTHGVIVLVPNGDYFHPLSMIVADPTNTTVEISLDDPANVLASASDLFWHSLTPAEFMQVLTPVSAVRLVQTGISSTWNCKLMS
jgi:hypothetical protein